MKRTGTITAIVLAVAPLLYYVLLQWPGIISPSLAPMPIQLVPFGLGILLFILGFRIHRIVDLLPVFVLLAWQVMLFLSTGTRNLYPVFPEIVVPSLILLTQGSLMLPYRRSMETICVALTAAAGLAILLVVLVPSGTVNSLSDLLNVNIPDGWNSPWSISDISALIFVTAAVVLTILPQENPRTLRFESLLALIPLFLYFELIGEEINRGDPALLICVSAVILIYLVGIGRLYLLHAYVDELTGLQNRRAFDERTKRLTGNYAISIIDIDHFKHFNDTYGHTEGDNALRWTAAHIADISGRRAYRYGGEEFCVVFPARLASAAGEEMEKLRHSLESDTFSIRRVARATKRGSDKRKRGEAAVQRKETLTVSIGVAVRHGRKGSSAEVLKRADKALYQAKADGRNRVSKAK